MADAELPNRRFSIAGLPERLREEAFREVYGRTILRVEAAPLGDGPIETDITVRAWPGVAIAVGRTSPLRAVHVPALVEDDDPVLIIVEDGAATLAQRGREAMLQAGQAALTSSGAAGVFTGHTTVAALNIRLDRAGLSARVADLDAALVRPLAADDPALRLLRGYVSAIDSAAMSAAPALAETVAAHVHDLVALVLGARRDAGEAARRGGLRAARLRAIEADIRSHLGRHDLSLEAVAARLRISSSYVRKLLDGEGTNFTDLVRGQRLARAHGLLTGPRGDGLSISAIAYEAGFGDLSYFNRIFRRRFGMTPSQARALRHRKPPFD